MLLTKVFRPHGSTEVVRNSVEIEVPLDENGIPAEYVLHLGVGFNADLILVDIRRSMDDDSVSTRICSPFGLKAEDLKAADAEAVFAHMDKMLQEHPDLGGFHIADKRDFNVYTMIEMGSALASDDEKALIEVDAMVVNQETGQLENTKCKVKNYMGYINVVSANLVWRKCISWLPKSELQGSPKLNFGAAIVSTMVDPRFYVNPAPGCHLDASRLLKLFGLDSLEVSMGRNETRAERASFVLNTAMWLPPECDEKEVLEHPSGYFHRLHKKYSTQLANRFPQEVANNIAMLFVAQKFLCFMWLVWLSLTSREPVFQFDPEKFFDGEVETAQAFADHFRAA